MFKNLKTARGLIALALVAVVFTSSGCYGPFKLTKKVHYGVSQIGGEWTNEFVFLGCVLVPVYMVSTMGDAFVFNAVEFWGGENPITPIDDVDEFEEDDDDEDLTRVIEAGNTKVILSKNNTDDGRSMKVEVFVNDQLIENTTVVAREDGSFLKLNSDGEVVASAYTDADGKLVIK